MRFSRRILILLAIVWALLAPALVLAESADFGLSGVQVGLSADQGLGQNFSHKFPVILIDARGSRGGNGDIAAAYLTVSDWLKTYQVTSRIDILVDENGKKRLLNLADGNALFHSRVKIIEESSPANPDPYSLYAVFANPSGTYRYARDLGTKFKFTPGAAFLVQTVLGNTENPNSLNPNATIETGGRVFDWAPAGLSIEESGVYADLAAQALRPMNVHQVKESLIAQLPNLQDEFSRESLSLVLNGDRLQGAMTGLAYGISAAQTQSQFMSYLHGLAGQTNQSFVLFTPSAFRESAVSDEGLKKHLRFVTALEQMPHVAEPNTIYIVETKTLPHRFFVTLMAYAMKSGVYPVGAGDGFLSAAIDLGSPFVLTQVAWNKRNIANLKSLLLDLALEHKLPSADITFLKELLTRNFEKTDFRTALALRRFAPLFGLLKSRIPKLSRRALEIALDADILNDSTQIPQTRDLVLQKSVLKGGRASTVSLAPLALQCVDAFGGLDSIR